MSNDGTGLRERLLAEADAIDSRLGVTGVAGLLREAATALSAVAPPPVLEGMVMIHAPTFLDVLRRSDWRTAANRAGLYQILTASPAAPAQPEMQAAPVAWIPASERLPDSLQPVLLCVEYASGKRRVIRAIYAAANTLELGDDQEWWPGCTEDEHENVYVPAGWYERNEYEATSWHVNDKAVAWQALPPPPTGE